MTTPRYPLRLRLDFRDRLALERTRLANERTLLAYLRSGMALVIAGLSLTEFFRGNLFIWVGVSFVPLGLVGMLVGWLRFRGKQATIEADIQDSLSHTEPAEPLTDIVHRAR